MKTYTVEKRENKFLEIIMFYIIEKQIIGGRSYIDYDFFHHKDKGRVQSKCNLLNILNN